MASNYDPDELVEAREHGADAARHVIEAKAPEDPVLRVAWTAGFGSEPDLTQAVQDAREAGATWATIATALGKNMRTVITKYGGGYEAQRRYRERLRAKGEQ